MATRVVRTSGPARAAITRAVTALQGLEGQVGWFSSSVYPDGVQVAYVAAIQEFGYPPKNIPPRMGLRGMAEREQPNWSKVVAYGARLMFNGQSTAHDMLELIGGVAEGSIRKQIASVWEPPLKEATIKARDRRRASGEASTTSGAKPLNDTGYMISTATHIVASKGSVT